MIFINLILIHQNSSVAIVSRSCSEDHEFKPHYVLISFVYINVFNLQMISLVCKLNITNFGLFVTFPDWCSW